ncbi:MAG TPA: hypothetical protein PKD34_00235, partial [Candidatus Doudnabacteria bacterium]|nr:hypothetical protein [Candidatus Doudnabacteria bacterium]
MPRRARSYEKHVPEPDPKFSSVKYAKFINYLMERGKKTTSQKIFYTALDIVEEKMSKSAPAGKDQESVNEEAEVKITDPRQIFDIALK